MMKRSKFLPEGVFDCVDFENDLQKTLLVGISVNIADNTVMPPPVVPKSVTNRKNNVRPPESGCSNASRVELSTKYPQILR